MLYFLIVGGLILGTLIIVHELGHFMAAKLGGVGVEKFSLGFPPKLIGKKWGDTEYLISAIPLGGYVKLVGQDPQDEEADPTRSYSTKTVAVRMQVVLAGPLFNLLFAAVILAVIHMIGIPSLTTKIGEVKEGSPAKKAGLLSGDRVVAIEGNALREWDKMTEIVHQSPGKDLEIVIERESRQISFRIRPEAQKVPNIFGEEKQVGLIGIAPAGELIYQRYNPLIAIYKGFEKTYQIIHFTVISIVKLIQGVIPAKTIGGPISIIQMAGEQARQGWLNWMFFVALLSVNLGILNLLPVPILDGGHIFFLLIEGFWGKPISVQKQEMAQRVGLLLLISLMLFAFYNDIMRLLGNVGN